MTDMTEGHEVLSDAAMVAETGMVALLNKSEIDQQISTAHKYPRSLKKFRDTALAMVTLTEEIARECIYALPRDGKIIEGPSARFAEVIASAWGNSRAGARVISDQGEFVTSQGVFHDLEQNVAITYEVQRRIVDKRGNRFKVDMIGVTANAACSIALRNAILKGIPKAFWSSLYQAARKTVMGDFKTLANRRADAITQFQAFGVSKEMIFAVLGVTGVEDIGLEQLVVLNGLMTAIKDGDTTVEQAFAQGDDKPKVKMPQSRGAQESATPAATPSHAQPGAADPAPTGNAPESNGGGAAGDSASPMASPGMIKNIRMKLKALAGALGQPDEAQLTDDLLVAHEIKALDGITVELGNKILAWIKSKQPAS